jgi:NTP pyrophosphatase (non-canonical NTP hydrolase)
MEMNAQPVHIGQFTNHVRRLFKPGDVPSRLLHASLGICGEGGELADAIKKNVYYEKDLDLENVLEECGDLLFYIQAMLDECGYTIEQAVEHNIAKLNKRYPQGYSNKAAQERADKAGGE